jgi:hypothetical protein
MTRLSSPTLVLLATLALATPAARLAAQASAPECSYERCALTLEPRWSGLALVRGADRTRVGELGFLWPGDVRRALAGSDSALVFGRRAVVTRRVGAALTDGGAALLALGAVRALHDGRLRGPGARTAAAGFLLLGASVPAQFAADGWLSRAVWWYNARFAR